MVAGGIFFVGDPTPVGQAHGSGGWRPCAPYGVVTNVLDVVPGSKERQIHLPLVKMVAKKKGKEKQGMQRIKSL